VTELLTNENPPSRDAIAQQLAVHPEYLPSGVSAEYLASCIVTELSRPSAGAGLAVDPAEPPLGTADIDLLRAIPTGNKNAHRYQRHVFRALVSVFNGILRLARVETPIDGGRKRIDITAMNQADGGFFAFTLRAHGIAAPQVVIECKNYSSDPSNEELDQLAGRLHPRQQFGILVTRSVKDRNTLAQRCQAYVRKAEYLIVLDDDDIATLITAAINDDHKAIDDLLTRRLTETINGAARH
jgi:hypothetical protein